MKKLYLFFLFSILFLPNVFAADFYATVAGAGAKDGTSPANAFDSAAMYTWIETPTAAYDRLYVESGTYTYLVAATLTPSASYSLIGVTDINDTALEAVTEDELPVFALGVYRFDNPGGVVIRNLKATSGGSRTISVSTGSYLNNVIAENTGAGTGISLLGAYGVAEQCVGRAVASFGIAASQSYVSLLGCVVDSGANGIALSGAGGEALDCIVYGVDSVGISATREGGLIVNCTIYNAGTIGMLIDATDQPRIRNSIISDCPVGIQSDAASTYQNFPISDYNNFWNNTIDVSFDGGLTEATGGKGRTFYELDPQFTDALSGDFSIGENLKGLGFPGSFPDGINTGYLDIGAVQREEQGGGGNGGTVNICQDSAFYGAAWDTIN